MNDIKITIEFEDKIKVISLSKNILKDLLAVHGQLETFLGLEQLILETIDDIPQFDLVYEFDWDAR